MLDVADDTITRVCYERCVQINCDKTIDLQSLGIRDAWSVLQSRNDMQGNATVFTAFTNPIEALPLQSYFPRGKYRNK